MRIERLVDSRGLEVLTATRVNVLTLVGLLMHHQDARWRRVEHILLVHPALTNLPAGTMLYKGPSELPTTLQVICRAGAPVSLQSQAGKHPVAVLNEMNLKPGYEEWSGTDGFHCRVTVPGYSAEGTGPSKRQAKSVAAATLVPQLPPLENCIRVRAADPKEVIRELQHTFGV